nr:hypothetical protein [Candidatus Sigynarchaeota archaeon]
MLPPAIDDFWNVDVRKERLSSVFRSLKGKDTVRVIFICGGNICRSPYAEMKFKKMLADMGCNKKVIVSSGGFIIQRDVYIHFLTERALKEAGVSEDRIKRHVPRHVRNHKDEMESVDLILSPTKTIIETLLPRRYWHKAFLMSEMSEAGEQINIEDPAPIQDYDEYMKIIVQIDPFLVALGKRLKKEGAC